MTNSLDQTAHTEALRVIQQVVWDLLSWAGLKLGATKPEDSTAIKEAKKHLRWLSIDTIKPLQVLFDEVKLTHGKKKEYFWRPQEIANFDPIIPYPILQAEDMEGLKKKIRDEVGFLNDNLNDWQNLSLLTLILEKFGSFISYGEENVALVDKTKTTAAVAAAIVKADGTQQTHLSIVAGDLSGIQNFIYTISSDGALKSLRARSFYLELVTEEVVAQLLTHLKLPRTNVIYAGGGNIYILAPGDEATKKTTQQVRLQFNQWLLDKFQGKVYLALDSSDNFPIQDIGGAEFSTHWSNATKKLAHYKARKFGDRIDELSQLTKPYYAHTPCKVCHRDDEENLKPLNDEPGAAMACSTCRTMFELGGKLFRVDAIVRSQQPSISGTQDAEDKIWFKLQKSDELDGVNICYQLYSFWKQVDANSDNVLLVNDWDLEHYRFRSFRNCAPILLGNYGKQTNDNRFMRAEEMAEVSQGIKRVGYLRMDVDRLGQIFAKGLNTNPSLAKLAGLSRQMSYFFKVYLNSLAKNRDSNIPTNIKQLPNHKNQDRNILFIYAGGDDLFVSGAWDEVVDFSFDIYQCFRAYTGYHPDITLSAGVSIADAKFPLYQAADESGDAESKAKNNGRDSLGLFNEVFKWDEWLGISDIKQLSPDVQKYLQSEQVPSLFGILPFVERLEKERIGINYSRNFVRNLIAVAKTQEQVLKQFSDKDSSEAMGNRYYLHLPKVAYTLSRLPEGILTDKDFRTSLKSPYNATYFRAISTWIELLNRQS